MRQKSSIMLICYLIVAANM